MQCCLHFDVTCENVQKKLFLNWYSSKPGDEFKAHVKEQHARSQGSQSNLLKDIDEETDGNSYGYKCFYCDTTIDSEQHLKEHKKVCHHLRLGILCITSASQNRE